MDKEHDGHFFEITRRSFLAHVGVGAAAVVAAGRIPAGATEKEAVMDPTEMTKVTLHVNGRTHRLLVEPRWPLKGF